MQPPPAGVSDAINGIDGVQGSGQRPSSGRVSKLTEPETL